MGEATSVIALAVAFGFGFLGVLQWATNLIKSNDKERQLLFKDLQTAKLMNIDLQDTINSQVLEINDLKMRFNRMASAAKRYKDELEICKEAKTENKILTETEITNIEADAIIEVHIEEEILNAE